MTNYKIRKDARDFGCKADWYNHENLGAVNAANPTRIVGGRVWPAAFFVFACNWAHNEMCETCPNFETCAPVAGPFSSETIAAEWAEMN